MSKKICACLILGVVLWVDLSAAKDGDECFSKVTRFNVCEKAREIQRAFASLLPMRLNTSIMLTTAASVGPRVIIVGIWNMKKPEMEAALSANNMSLADLQGRMEETTRTSVCSQESSAAFVRLGGQMQYSYKTSDGHVVLSPIVTECPGSN